MKIDDHGNWRVEGYLHPKTYAWVIEKKWDAGKAPFWLVKRYVLACIAWERHPTNYVKSVEYEGMILRAYKGRSGPNLEVEGGYYGVQSGLGKHLPHG